MKIFGTGSCVMFGRGGVAEPVSWEHITVNGKYLEIKSFVTEKAVANKRV